jgi:hypothetical protein
LRRSTACGECGERGKQTAAALAKLPVTTAYIDEELCGVRPDGATSFELMQQATDRGTGALVYFAAADDRIPRAARESRAVVTGIVELLSA